MQVPVSALYIPPNAVDTVMPSEARAVISDDIDGDGAKLLHAYRRIRDPEARRRILSLVQAMAERS